MADNLVSRIQNVGRTYRNFKRYREIIFILVKYGFADVISKTQLDKLFNISTRILTKKKSFADTPENRYERVRMAIEDLGPTFIKFGQVMSNRPDLLPLGLIQELQKLQKTVTPFGEDDVRKTILNEYGKPVEEIFKKLNYIPIGSASIAQVHEAELFNNQKVVLKIQRPGIRRKIEIDIEIMAHLASLMEKHSREFNILSPTSVVEEFAKTIRKEIDFNIEKSYILRFARNFKNNPNIYVPKIYNELCTKKILAMEYIDGICLSNNDLLNKHNISPLYLASKGTDLILQQIFKYGFFHADPHPGNILIKRNKQIVFLDFGMMGTLLPRYKELLGDFILAFVNGDTQRITKVILKMSLNNPIINTNEFEAILAELLQDFMYMPLNEIDIKEVMNKTLNLVVNYEIRMPPSMYLLVRSLVTIEGIARQLDPNFNLFIKIRPYAKQLIKQKMNPVNKVKSGYLTLIDMLTFIKEFPAELIDLFDQIKHGKTNIILEHKGLDEFMKKNDQISNRISFSIIVAALIIGSSLMAMSSIPPLWHNIPVIGVAGFLVTGFMGFWLLISIIKRGKL